MLIFYIIHLAKKRICCSDTLLILHFCLLDFEFFQLEAVYLGVDMVWA